MSDIAHALAKAKERTGQTTAPFLAPGAIVKPDERSAASAAAIRKARMQRGFWIVIACVSLPLTAFVLWTRLGGAKAESAAEAGAGKSEITASAHIPKPPVPPPAAGPRPEIAEAVAALSISAVIPGNPARIMMGSRVIRGGELVEGELTFVGVAEGLLQFSDAHGVIYTRRY